MRTVMYVYVAHARSSAATVRSHRQPKGRLAFRFVWRAASCTRLYHLTLCHANFLFNRVLPYDAFGHRLYIHHRHIRSPARGPTKSMRPVQFGTLF